MPVRRRAIASRGGDGGRHRRARACQIDWHGFPAELRATAKRHIDKWSWLIPPWCTALQVEYVTEPDGGHVAATSADMEYRQARIQLTPIFFDARQADTREEYVVHELVHLLLWPQSIVTDDVIGRLATEGVLREWATEQARKGLEAATQDLSRAIVRGMLGSA